MIVLFSQIEKLPDRMPEIDVYLLYLREKIESFQQGKPICHK